jgi:hypothetical protein
MAYTESELVQLVAAKIDEILPPGENVPSGALIEAPIPYIEKELKESGYHILRQAPVTQIKQVIKKATTHFPQSPAAFTGLITVGGTNVTNNNLVSINNVNYNINGNPYGGNPMPVTVASDPAAGQNRRDIIVGNDLGELEYIVGTPNANPDLLDFPNTPAGKVLVMKVIILDNESGGFTKTYTGGTTVGSASNPTVRLVASNTANAYLVPCPTDFLRFINIKLSTWALPVSELIPEEDPKYREQKAIKWTRGTELKPKAALVSFSDYVAGEINATYPNLGLAVECFSSKTLPTLSAFHYVPKVTPTSMPEDLVDAMVWECAGRTLLIMKQAERAAIAFQQVQRYFSNKYGLIGE